MPSAYTEGVQKGTITEFRDFAELCLRSRGVAVTLRDEPLSLRVPDEMVLDEYYYTSITQAEAELAEAQVLDGEQLLQETYEVNHAAKRRNLEREQERALERRRYEEMLAHARAWQPPTPEHDDLKDFMVSQLEDSLDFDCGSTYSEYDKLTPEEYKAARIKDATWKVEYYTDLRSKMEAKYHEGTEYIRAFRASL